MSKTPYEIALAEGLFQEKLFVRHIYVVDNILYVEGRKKEDEDYLVPIMEVTQTDMVEDPNFLEALLEVNELLKTVESSTLKRLITLRSAVAILEGIFLSDDYDVVHLFILGGPNMDIEENTLALVKFVDTPPERENDIVLIPIGGFYEDGIKSYPVNENTWSLELMVAILNLTYYRRKKRMGEELPKRTIVCENTTRLVIQAMRNMWVASDTTEVKEQFLKDYIKEQRENEH